MSPEHSSGVPYSRLAWELAHHVTFSGAVEGPPVIATLPTFTLLNPIEGRGNTTSEAMRAVARALDEETRS